MAESPTQLLREEHELVLVVVEAIEREVAFIDTMPMTTTDKVIRRLLREKA